MRDKGNQGREDMELEIELAGLKKRAGDEGGRGHGVFVEVSENSSRFINEYCSSDTARELAGILLGGYAEKEGHFHVFVEAAIEAKFTDASRGSVTFTHQSWEYINRVRDEEYPELSMVGWFHTHPGFGIFLSGYDKFIHQNFFNLPWQIAFVLDPIAHEQGIFGWKEKDLIKVPYNAAPAGKPRQETRTEKAPATSGAGFDTAAGKQAQPGRKTGLPLGRVAVAAVIAGLLFLNGYLFMSRQEAQGMAVNMADALQEERQRAAELEDAVNDAEAELNSLREEENRLREELARVYSQPLYYPHIVGEGDTLAGLSERYLNDSGRYRELAELNRLEDPDLIITGEPILVPFNPK